MLDNPIKVKHIGIKQQKKIEKITKPKSHT